MSTRPSPESCRVRHCGPDAGWNGAERILGFFAHSCYLHRCALDSLRPLSPHLASDEPMDTMIAEAVEKLRRERFMDEVNASFAALRADPVLWAKELEERALWENTRMDGLEDDPYPARPGDLPGAS